MSSNPELAFDTEHTLAPEQSLEIQLIEGGGEADSDDNSTRPERRLNTAARAGSTLLEVVTGQDDDDQRYRGGGGSWLIREYMKKQEAEAKKAEARTHEDTCSCEICQTH